ncbi:MAG: DsbA family protein [Haloarculaceae archaeon]
MVQRVSVDGGVSRRRLLATGAALAASAAAGCLGGGNGGGGGTDAKQQLPTPVAGDPDADVTVTVFEDFRCPHCRQYNLQELPDVWSEYVDPGLVRYEHRDFPVVNDTSWTAANAARSVQNLGTVAKFWTYAKLLFANQSKLGPDAYAALGNEVDVDGKKVRSAANNRAYDPTIRYDRQTGRDQDVRATPTILVDGTKVTDADGNLTHSTDAVAAAIERARSESG